MAKLQRGESLLLVLMGLATLVCYGVWVGELVTPAQAQAAPPSITQETTLTGDVITVRCIDHQWVRTSAQTTVILGSCTS